MTRFYRVLFLLVASGFLAPAAFSQGHALDKTTLGKSQNSPEDLMNSLVPGPQRYGKNEKKAEVDPKTLPSKKTNDTTFSGSLNDIGVDWHSDKMGKPHASSDAESKSAKQSDAEAKKDSKPAKSAEAGDNAQSKEPKTASVHDEKSAAKEKAAAAKTDGDH